ncbi:MAG: DoxX family protein [Chitinophagaceae bacterium]|nr:DoxX family protein [Chitinophagaceae bacterium]
MKKLMSTSYSAGAFNAGMLLFRFGIGVLMINHGYDKLVHFSQMQKDFVNFLGLGQTISLCMVVFAEFFCSLFLILGLFTRLSAIPLLIAMCVALFKAHNSEIFGLGEKAAMYLCAYLLILILGPGKISVDGMSGK